MEKQSLNNFYIPNTSNRFVMVAISRKTFEEIEEAAKADADSSASQFPPAIIDR